MKMRGVLYMTGCLKKIELKQAIVDEFLSILENETVRTLYQPIININNGSILGYESLSRGPENSPLESPLTLLSVAEQVNRSWELEQLLRTKALERASFSHEALLFLNIDPNIIHDDSFRRGFTKEFLADLSISPSSIVFELTERSAIENYDNFKSVLAHYTEQGYGIAIDDAGSGYSGLKTLYEIYPKYLKIDMDFVRNIDKDPFKQSIVKNLLQMANSANIYTIAEGIETAEELRTLIRLGVEYGQGYFIQKPLEKIQAINPDVLMILNRERELIYQVDNFSHDYHYIHHLMEPVKAFSPDEKCIHVFNYLNEHGHAGACVCENNYPVGIVNIREINAAFAKQYGHSVYAHRPINLITDTSPLIVDYYTPIQTVAQKALARNNQKLYDDIIVSKGSYYAGTVTMKKLLEYAINYEKNYAKELNPLTSLPGNVIINRVMKSAVTTERETFVLYADLDNFKAFNDIYGFDQGDKIIKLTAEILEEMTDKHFPYTTFLGHIGGDDFVIVAEGDRQTVDILCQEIIHAFDRRVQNYFSVDDRQQGHFRGQDRHGKTQEFSLTAISLAGIIGPLNTYNTVESLSSTLATLKKNAKSVPSSSYLIENIGTTSAYNKFFSNHDISL